MTLKNKKYFIIVIFLSVPSETVRPRKPIRNYETGNGEDIEDKKLLYSPLTQHKLNYGLNMALKAYFGFDKN